MLLPSGPKALLVSAFFHGPVMRRFEKKMSWNRLSINKYGYKSIQIYWLVSDDSSYFLM